MKLKRLLVKLKLRAFLRLCKKQIHEPPTVEMEYALRTEDLVTREVRYRRYESMDQIVKYVYFDVPVTIPNYTSKNYTLVHKNLHSGKEHIIQLKTGKRPTCEYDNWHPAEII